MAKLSSIVLLINIISIVVSPAKSSDENRLTLIAKNIINSVFDVNDCLVFIRNDMDQDVIIKALFSLRIPAVMHSLETRQDEVYCTGYIFFEEDYSKLERLLIQPLSYSLELRPRTKVLVFFSGSESFSTYGKLNSNIFGSDIIIIDNFINHNNKKIHDIRFISISNLDTLNNFRSEVVNGTQIKYVKKLWTPTYWKPIVATGYHCPPHVYYSEEKGAYDGVDIMIFQEITKQWQTQFKAYSPKANKLFENMFKNIGDRDADVCLCSPWQALTPYRMYTTIPYTSHCLTFLVHKPYIENMSFLVLQLAAVDGWIGFVPNSIVVAIFITIFARILRNNKYSNLTDNLLTLVRFTTYGSISNFDSARGSIRFLLLCYALYSMIMATIFSAALTTSITNPLNVHPPNTIEQLAAQGIRWAARSGDGMDVFIDQDNPVYMQMLKSHDPCMTIKERNSLIRINKNVPVLVQLLPYGYVKGADTLDKYGWSHLQVMQECFNTFLVSFALSKSSPLGPIFDDAISRYVEHGLITHWYNSLSLRDKNVKYMEKFRHSENKDDLHEVRLFNLEMLQGAFYLWLAGLIIALFTFVMELRSSKHERI